MARVNIEESLLSGFRLDRALRELAIPRAFLLGMLVDLYHESQTEEVCEATGEEICDWARLYEFNQWVKETNLREVGNGEFLTALIAGRLIKGLPGGRYRIHGNEEQISGLRGHREKVTERNRKGGEIRAASADRDEHGHFISSKNASDDAQPNQQPSEVQPSQQQCNSLQSSTKQSIDLPPQAAEVVSGSPAWDAYAIAYERRYHSPPVRNAKTNSLCKQLVQRLGASEAPEVASFYVTHEFPLYISAGHDLSLLIRDCEKIRTEWKTGRPIQPKSRAQLVSDGNQALLAKVRRGEA